LTTKNKDCKLIKATEKEKARAFDMMYVVMNDEHERFQAAIDLARIFKK
jgi:hypothetical protein